MRFLKLSFLIAVIACENWPENKSQEFFDFGKEEYGVSAIPYSDGGMIIGGTTTSIRGNQDMLLMRLDDSHQKLWVKAIGGNAIDRCHDVFELSDHSVVAVGSVQKSVGNNDMLIVRLSKYGEIIWSKNIGGIYNEEARAVVQANDGNIIVAGTTASFGAGSNDVFLIKMSLDGSLIWQKTYGDQKMSGAYDIQSTDDNGFIIAGYMSGGSTPYDAMLTKISENGDEEWTRTYPFGYKTDARQVVVLPDQNFLVTGIAGYSNVPGSNSSFAFRADAGGNILWFQNYNTSVNNEAFSAALINEQTAVITGFIDGKKTQLYTLTIDLS
ncbi:MAG TPA: hypothetical protein PLG25_06665, partial [bacterium]|nr:hypothetical protein [bacterium]